MQAELRDQLRDLLMQERTLYGELEDMVAREERLVAEQEWGGLLRVLEAKQALISRQEKLQESWAGCASLMEVQGGRETPTFWDAVAVRVGTGSYRELLSLVDDLRSVASRTLEREREVQQQLEGHLDELRKKMLQMQRGKEAFKTYARAGATTIG